ncbi:MAG: PDZ domain-containing protein [Planctomycetota bacterium]|nr:MAG: PDZ domain-containing protein [Planctomycetota bacterium]
MEAFLSGGNLILALLGFAFVIFIHELGHFVFAKWAGVRVEVFSIGFGPIVWSRTIGETRYALSLLPLGGYVRMLGHEDLPAQPGEEEHHPQSFQSKHPGWKAAILFGGVLFNFISSWLILVALAFYGMPHFPAIVGEVATTIPTTVDGEHRDVPSPALALGVQRGDQVVSLNGERVRDFEDMLFATLSAGTNPISLEVIRDGERLRLPADADAQVRPIYSVAEGKVALGLGIMRSRRVARSIDFGSPSALASGWLLTAIDGEELGDISGQEADSLLLPHAGREVDLQFQRGREEQSLRLRYAGPQMDIAGMFGLPVSIQQVVEGSPADVAGLRPGDMLLAMDGEPLAGVTDLRARVARSQGKPVSLTIWRSQGSGWQEITAEMAPSWDPVNQQFLIGIHMGGMSSGRLPAVLPPALGGLPSPLAEAGIAGNSILLDSHFNQSQHRLDLRVLPPESESTLIPLSEEAWRALDRFRTVALVSKLAGFRDTPARSRSLLGARITATGPGGSGHPRPGHITVEARAGSGDLRERAVDLSDLPSACNRRILEIPPGAYIVSTTRYNETGQRCIEIIVPPDSQRPQSMRLEAAPIGTLIAFGIEERPYELESITEAFTLANHKSMQMIGKTLSLIPRFFMPGEEGGISAERSLHGPIGIFSELQARLQHLGFPSFLRLVALIGLNLFLINLLPIPITDGGQLVILGIEVGIRRPIPPLILNIINTIGFLLIVSLMLFVIGLDVARQIFGY